MVNNKLLKSPQILVFSKIFRIRKCLLCIMGKFCRRTEHPVGQDNLLLQAIKLSKLLKNSLQVKNMKESSNLTRPCHMASLLRQLKIVRIRWRLLKRVQIKVKTISIIKSNFKMAKMEVVKLEAKVLIIIWTISNINQTWSMSV